MNGLERLARIVERTAASVPLVTVDGRVAEVAPSACRVAGLSAFSKLGDLVELGTAADPHFGEVIRVERTTVTVKSLAARPDLGLGQRARRIGPVEIAPDASWKGRVVDALGAAIDGKGPLAQGARVRVERSAPAALDRGRVSQPIRTGVRAMDIFSPLCAGQRIGIFAGSGVGKSTLLAMLAGARGFDSVVVALVGERGREVRDFLEDALGANRSRAVAVVATGDESAMMRRLAPRTAVAIAECFRDAGETVLLIVDSVTRYAHACRDVALAAGEPAVARGYPPSVFGDLPRLLERAGPGPEGGGSITGVFSVLVDGDDHNDPVADTIRGTLDGHIVLDRRIAAQGRYPAVDLLGSLSRLAGQVWSPEQAKLVAKLREMIARFEDTRDLRAMGGYQPGADAELDQAVLMVPRIYAALAQAPTAPPSDDPFRDLAAALQKAA